MTLEEAKKILKKEVFGIRFKKFDKPLKFEEKLWIRNEKPEVLEALHIVAKNGIGVSVPETALRIRSLIIKKMKAGEGEPAPVSGTPLSAAEGMKLRWKDNKNTDKNPALAESASQFNDALLDEQGKKIEKLANENERLKDQVAVLDVCKKHNDKINRKQIKGLGKEIAKLNGIIHDKNAVLADVAEELRLSKIREKNLTELCQKYIKANKELKEKLANKVVDKIDAQALKSAESALAYKEKVIADLTKKLKSINMNRHNERIYKKQLAEKDEVIEKLQKQLKYKSSLPSGSVEAINIYVDNISRARRGGFNKPVASTMGETELSETYEYGDKKLKYALHFNEDGSITFECSDPDKKNCHNGDGLPTPEEPKHDNSFKDFINKAIDNYNRRAAELGCAGSKDGNGIFDQMVGVDIAEEGEDHSGVIVLCGKDFIDSIKKMK